MWLAALLLAFVAPIAAGCGSANPLGGGSASGDLKTLVVGSADFPESKIIAEIYAQALEANGFTVGRQFGIGSRETYIPQCGTTRSTWCPNTPETCCSTLTEDHRHHSGSGGARAGSGAAR